MTKQSQSIDTLLKERDEMYDEATKEIFEKYGVKLAQALAFVTNVDRDTHWESFEKYSDKSNLVYALGHISYKIGDIVPTADGLKVVKSEGYKGKVRLLVTSNTLENSPPLEIYQEIMRLISYESALSDQESYELFSDSNFFGKITNKSPTHGKFYDKIKSTMKKDDFDMDELSPLQQTSFKLSEHAKDKTEKRIIH